MCLLFFYIFQPYLKEIAMTSITKNQTPEVDGEIVGVNWRAHTCAGYWQFEGDLGSKKIV